MATTTRKKKAPAIPLVPLPKPDFTATRQVLRNFAILLESLKEDFEKDSLELRMFPEYLESNPKTMTKQPSLKVSFTDLEKGTSFFTTEGLTIRFAAESQDKIMISDMTDKTEADLGGNIIFRLEPSEEDSLMFLEDTLNNFLEQSLG